MDSESGDFILGSKIENAYSKDNMIKAYVSLKEKGEISTPISISTTHLYIKLTPKDSVEMNRILADTNLEIFPYPLDYKIEGEGEFVVDEEAEPELYTVIPVGYHMDEMIHYDVLEECFIPDEDPDKPELALLEMESLKLTDNYFESQDEEKPNMSKWSISYKYPKGYVKVKNTEGSNYEGVRGIKVRIHNIVKISSTYTNANGYYSCSRGFLSNVHYSAVFENSRGFKIWSNIGPFSPAIHNVGWHSKSGYNINIDTNSCAWPWATINNAALDYYDKICPEFKISKPYSGLRFWYLSGCKFVDKISNGWSGSTPMLRNLTLGHPALTVLLFTLGVLEEPSLSKLTAAVFGIMLCSPDIFITKVKVRNTKTLRATIFHEMSHASHYSQVGPIYWAQYIAQICYNYINSPDNNAYGDSQNDHNNIIGVGEMWASYFEYQCTDKFYHYDLGLSDTYAWYAPQILKYIEDNAEDITPKKIFDAFVFQVQSHSDLEQELIGRYGQSEIITKAFADNNF